MTGTASRAALGMMERHVQQGVASPAVLAQDATPTTQPTTLTGVAPLSLTGDRLTA